MDRVDLERTRNRPVRDYTVVRQIGKGSFGIVSLVTKDSKEFAMKMMNLKNLEEKDINRCQQEGKTMKRYVHSHLVKLHELFKEGDKVYIIMEYCEGGSLRDYLRRQHGDLAEGEVVQFMLQIATAIQFLHQQDMIHRDVKTANIFITRDLKLKLGDMALTRECRANFSMTMMAGTPIYMSPEVIQCEKYDQKTDIWSLGCCFYELCYREYLFKVATSIDTLRDMIEMCKKTSFRINLSKNLNRLFQSMICYRAQERPSIDDVLQCLVTCTHNPTRHSFGIKTPSASHRASDATSRCRSSSSDTTEISQHTHRTSPEPVTTKACSQRTKTSPTALQRHRTSSASSQRHRTSSASSQRHRTSPTSSYRHRTSPTSSQRHISQEVVSSSCRRQADNVTSDYGTDTELRPDDITYVARDVKVLMTEKEYDWYLKSVQLQTDLRKTLDSKTMKALLVELENTKTLEEVKHFLDKAKQLMDKTTFQQCKPDLASLWQYRTPLLNTTLKLA